ncbi:MAG: electron transfer flavoprotein subunit alpha/FixB family protein [Candidatus Kapaibacterium sp.]
MSTTVVFLESKGNQIKRSSLEAITAAHGISNGGSVLGIIIGATASDVAVTRAYGLTSCALASHSLLGNYSSTAVAATVAQYAASVGASSVIFPATATGKELAPRVAVKLQAGFIPDCVALEMNNGTIQATRPVYAGKAKITAKVSTPVGVYSLRPNVFTARTIDGAGEVKVEEFSPSLTADDCNVTVTSVVRNEGKLDVSEADVVVSGGRGLKGPENFHLVESLGKVLGAAIGASRAVVDAGWRPHGEQVGQTGKTVSPNLYVACGISGAVQHLAGMSSSKVIVAINKDKDAPIFKVADYGIVGDVFDVLPKLTAKLTH